MNKHELFLTVVKDSFQCWDFYAEYFAETQTYCQKILDIFVKQINH